MSFKGFTDTDVNELRKNLKKRANLASEYKEQIDNQQGITNYINKVAIQNSKPIIDALAKERDERLKSTTGSVSEADELRILETTPLAIIEYFKTLRPDLFKNVKETEISLLTIPMKLMKSEVEIRTDGRKVLLIIKIGTNPDVEIPLDLPLTWMLLFDIQTLQKYGLIKKITDKDIDNYSAILYEANEQKRVAVQKIAELRDTKKQKRAKLTVNPIWEDPKILNMSFMGFVDYLLANAGEAPNDKAIEKFFTSTKKYNEIFTYKDFITGNVIKEQGLTISDNKPAKKKNPETREGYIDLLDRKNNKGNIITVRFPYKDRNKTKYVYQPFQISNRYSKFRLLLTTEMLNEIKAKLLSSTGNDDLYNQVYNLSNLDPADDGEVKNDVANITEYVFKLDKGKGIMQTEEEADQDLSGYGVLRDPFKDARTVKSRKGNSMHKSYIISGGMFGDLEVNVPKLYTQMHLTAKKGGAIVLDAPVDLDTIELLTKRPKRTRSYSQLAVKNLAKMVKLSDQAVNPNSKKLKMVQKYHSKKRAALPVNADDATIERLTTLILEHQAGNYPNTNLQNEIAQISDTLLKQGMITEKMHKEIYSKYVL